MESAALVGWSPGQFWGATPFELGCAIRGYGIGQEHNHYLAAWHFAMVHNMIAKPGKQIRNIKRLVKPGSIISIQDFESPEAFAAALEKPKVSA